MSGGKNHTCRIFSCLYAMAIWCIKQAETVKSQRKQNPTTRKIMGRADIDISKVSLIIVGKQAGRG